MQSRFQSFKFALISRERTIRVELFKEGPLRSPFLALNPDSVLKDCNYLKQITLPLPA